MTEDDPPPGAGTSGSPETRSDGHEEATAVESGTNAVDDAGDGPADPERGRPTEELLTDSRTIEGAVRWKWALRALVGAAIFGVVVGVISVFVIQWGPLPGVVAAVFVAILSVGHVLLLYRSWQYEVREDALYLQRGVFTHVKTVVPFVRVQHIDTSRDPFDRVIGLSSLVVYTAGSRGADVTVPGLTPEDAADLQERLKLLAKESTGDDAV